MLEQGRLEVQARVVDRAREADRVGEAWLGVGVGVRVGLGLVGEACELGKVKR